ncbi:glycosyltransferase [Salarchaeum japonicum]|uniref:UDP:flavonoid glycosyltransferase YjiC, YdhE family n=1 Tax=Salarchaeum japonicum TaxID=555573 RepID=A0AAV3SY15_9EURY|nr:glycosyltransferase [Salarchaeum japonicum]
MHVAVAHYPEGAGHATRMLAVTRELEARGARVSLAGGGPGERFADLLGYDEYVPTRVDFIGDYQDGGGLADVLTGSLPDSARRVRDFYRWLRRENPDALVTDDMFAAMAAPMARVPLYVCTHNAPGLYDDTVERAGAWALTAYQVAAARDFLFPAVWPPGDADPMGVSRIPPLALDADAPVVGDPDVVMVPSTYSDELDAAADGLRENGRRVTVVGGDGWEPVASMLPTLRAANLVVCPGYSTVMEAAVAGTPTLIYPFTSEQRGVARLAARATGFRTVTSSGEVVAAAADPPDPPAFENGAGVVADAVLS